MEKYSTITDSRKIYFYWSLVFIYLLLIYYLSSLHLKLPKISVKNYDKAVHAIEYGILSFLFFKAITVTKKYTSILYPMLLSIALTVTFSVTDEIHQMFVPYRSPEIYDLAADTIGAVTVQIAIYCYITIFKKIGGKR